jgi:hypothetical protein
VTFAKSLCERNYTTASTSVKNVDWRSTSPLMPEPLLACPLKCEGRRELEQRLINRAEIFELTQNDDIPEKLLPSLGTRANPDFS